MIKTEKVTYSNSKNTFEGVIAWNDSLYEKRPVILVVHNYKGQFEFDVEKAKDLAKLGYLGFAIDMYGKGIRANTPKEADALMRALNEDRKELLKRIRLAVEKAKDFELADPSKIGALGFCFGGKCVLDLARSGDQIKGVASFHGVYDPPNIEYSGPIKAAILVLHGWGDPLATPQQTIALAQELTQKNADWNISAYGHTGHAFTNPYANSKETGMFFNASSNRRSWQLAMRFFEELFTD